MARLQCAINIHICEGCVAAGAEALAGQGDPAGPVAKVDGAALTCAVCNNAHAPNVPLLVPASDRTRPGICAECFALVQDIDAEERNRRGAAR